MINRIRYWSSIKGVMDRNECLDKEVYVATGGALQERVLILSKEMILVP